MKEFIKNLMALDEEKGSIIILMYILTHFVGIWKAFKTGDYPDNLLYLDQFYVGAIISYSGVKIFKKTPLESPVLSPPDNAGGINLSDNNK